MKEIKIEDTDLLLEKVLDALQSEDIVHIVGEIEWLWDMAIDLYINDEAEFSIVDIDKDDYDREYIFALYKNKDEKTIIAIEQAYNMDSNKYYGVDGLVYVHGTVNHKFISDVEQNDFINDFRPVIFTFDEDDECAECGVRKSVVDNRVIFTIPVCLEEMIHDIDELIFKFFDL